MYQEAGDDSTPVGDGVRVTEAETEGLGDREVEGEELGEAVGVELGQSMAGARGGV